MCVVASTDVGLPKCYPAEARVPRMGLGWKTTRLKKWLEPLRGANYKGNGSGTLRLTPETNRLSTWKKYFRCYRRKSGDSNIIEKNIQRKKAKQFRHSFRERQGI